MTVTDTPLMLYDEGSALGRIRSLNFVGPNIVASKVGDRGIIYASKERPIDDPTYPVSYIYIDGQGDVPESASTTPAFVLTGGIVSVKTDDVVYNPTTGRITFSNANIYIVRMEADVVFEAGDEPYGLCYGPVSPDSHWVETIPWKFINVGIAGSTQFNKCYFSESTHCTGNLRIHAGCALAVQMAAGNSLFLTMQHDNATLHPDASVTYHINIRSVPKYYAD